MITTEIYNGQGLGNQLHCYVTTRVLALDKRLPFGIQNPHKFKCLDFMDLDFGLPVIGGSGPEGGPPTSLPEGIRYYLREKEAPILNGRSDVRLDDPALDNIEDGTKIDGNFQSETRILHRKEEIKQWLKVKPEKDCYEYASDDICVLNFRGGDYSGMHDFFLHPNYWINAINRMYAINPKFRFVVITDDVPLASRFFPMFEVHHFSIAKDFSIIKNAHYLILSNSSFAFFPTFISERNKYIFAPKYWGRHNISDGYWHCGYNIYRSFNYIDRENRVSTFTECDAEFKEYQAKNKHLWQ